MNSEEQQSMKLIEYFLQNPGDLDKLSRQDCKDVLRLASMTAEGTKEESIIGRCYDLLYECCFHMDLDIRELWNIYWILTGRLFDNARIPFNGQMDKLYRLVFLKVKEALPNTHAPYESTSSNLIIITTNQFLGGINHAPTRRVLDYAYAMIMGLGKAVMIVNSAGLNYYKCHCIKDGSSYNYDEDLNKIKQINYKEVNIPFMQIDAKMPDLYCIKEALDDIYDLRPELVYDIGGANFICDLCSEFVKTCSFPCSTNIPITMSRYLLVGRKLRDSDSERLSRLEDYQQTIETVVNYQLPKFDENIYKRSDYNLSDSDFVFGIVGNRLDYEISDSFIELMNQLLLDLDAHFLIIGTLLNTGGILERVSMPERIHIAGSIPDAVNAVRLFDVYLNPYRNGGGRSSFEALAQGVPVITFAYGDVYHTCGDEFVVEDDGEFLETASRYMTDCGYREEQKLRGLKRAERLSNIALTQKEVLDKILR